MGLSVDEVLTAAGEGMEGESLAQLAREGRGERLTDHTANGELPGTETQE